MKLRITSFVFRSTLLLAAWALMISLVGAVCTLAQDAAKSQPSSSESRREAASKPVSEAAETEGAAEKDEMAEFKESASVRFLARIFGMKPQTAYWAFVILNFAIVAGAIFFLSRMHLPTLFRSRTESIRKAMDDAQRASAEARQRLNDIEIRLGKLDGEIAAMRAAAEKDAAAEEERLRAAADEDRKKIVESAEQEIAAAAKSARRDLTAYAADLAITLAQKRISVDAATDQSLVKNFAEKLGGGKGDR